MSKEETMAETLAYLRDIAITAIRIQSLILEDGKSLERGDYRTIEHIEGDLYAIWRDYKESVVDRKKIS